MHFAVVRVSKTTLKQMYKIALEYEGNVIQTYGGLLKYWLYNNWNDERSVNPYNIKTRISIYQIIYG